MDTEITALAPLFVDGNMNHDLPSTFNKAAEKRLSASFLSSFVIAAYIKVRLTSQDFACLREAASAKAGAPCI